MMRAGAPRTFSRRKNCGQHAVEGHPAHQARDADERCQHGAAQDQRGVDRDQTGQVGTGGVATGGRPSPGARAAPPDDRATSGECGSSDRTRIAISGLNTDTASHMLRRVFGNTPSACSSTKLEELSKPEIPSIEAAKPRKRAVQMPPSTGAAQLALSTSRPLESKKTPAPQRQQRQCHHVEEEDDDGNGGRLADAEAGQHREGEQQDRGGEQHRQPVPEVLDVVQGLEARDDCGRHVREQRQTSRERRDSLAGRVE